MTLLHVGLLLEINLSETVETALSKLFLAVKEKKEKFLPCPVLCHKNIIYIHLLHMVCV